MESSVGLSNTSCKVPGESDQIMCLLKGDTNMTTFNSCSAREPQHRYRTYTSCLGLQREGQRDRVLLDYL